MKLSVTITEAAAMTGISAERLRQYIHATEGPILRAKRSGNKPKSPYLVKVSDLDAFIDSLADA